jgi:Methyl-accepting chemotaxis protein (MCP) signalling domain
MITRNGLALGERLLPLGHASMEMQVAAAAAIRALETADEAGAGSVPPVSGGRGGDRAHAARRRRDRRTSHRARAMADLRQQLAALERDLGAIRTGAEALLSEVAIGATNPAVQAEIVAAETASTGRSIVGDVVNAIRQIDASAQEVKKIVGVINEISFQTNLLALNAGVEAAPSRKPLPPARRSPRRAGLRPAASSRSRTGSAKWMRIRTNTPGWPAKAPIPLASSRTLPRSSTISCDSSAPPEARVAAVMRPE